MKSIPHTLLLGLMCYLASWSLFAAPEATFPKVQMVDTEERILTSKFNDQRYKIWVKYPRLHNKNNDTYPVIYLLDAQWDFPLMASLYDQLSFDGYAPDAFIVGITWDAEEDDILRLRFRDLTPTKVEAHGDTGGAEQFLAMLKQELIPMVNQDYRVNDQRFLVGCSLGGLFTLYTLFNDETLFNGYLPTATSAWWDNQVMLKLAEDYAKKAAKAEKRQQPTKVYTAVGEFDGVKSSFTQLTDLLQTDAYSHLDLQVDTFPNIGHGTVKSMGNIRGLQYLFASEHIALSQQQLDSLAGQYHHPESGMQIQVFSEADRLIVINPQGQRETYNSLSPTEFSMRGAYLKAQFHPEKQPMELTVKLFEGEFSFVRKEAQ